MPIPPVRTPLSPAPPAVAALPVSARSPLPHVCHLPGRRPRPALGRHLASYPARPGGRCRCRWRLAAVALPEAASAARELPPRPLQEPTASASGHARGRPILLRRHALRWPSRSARQGGWQKWFNKQLNAGQGQRQRVRKYDAWWPELWQSPEVPGLREPQRRHAQLAGDAVLRAVGAHPADVQQAPGPRGDDGVLGAPLQRARPSAASTSCTAWTTATRSAPAHWARSRTCSTPRRPTRRCCCTSTMPSPPPSTRTRTSAGSCSSCTRSDEATTARTTSRAVPGS